jgi:hypothetical protein
MVDVVKRHLTALMCLLALHIALAADIGVSPPRIEVTGRAGDVLTLTGTVLTTAATSQLVASDLSDWTIAFDGTTQYTSPGTLLHSASTWLVPDSAEFVLEPRSSHDVRLSVSIPNGAEGTHHAMVFFSVTPPPAESRGVGVITTTRVGLTVYVTVAGTERNGSELVDMYQSDDRSLATVILNTGNTVMRLGGVIEIRDEAGDVVRRLDVPDVPVLRESERELTFTLPDDLESGFYVALALIEDSRGGVLAGELPFDVP